MNQTLRKTLAFTPIVFTIFILTQITENFTLMSASFLFSMVWGLFLSGERYDEDDFDYDYEEFEDGWEDEDEE